MKKQADYIKRIEIKRLWGRKDISWELRPDVNILSGVNGIGKSTILNRSVNSLTALEGGALSNGSTPGVHFVFSPEDATLIHFDVIRSFDRPLIHSELLEKMADKNVKTELDWQLYQLQRRYLDYQVNIGNRIIECLTSGGPDGQLRAAEMSYPKTKFQDLMDDLFGETGKKSFVKVMRFCLNRMEIYFILINCLPVRSRFWYFADGSGTRQPSGSPVYG